MKIKINQKELNNTLKVLQKVLSKKNNNPILMAVYFKVSGLELTMRVTDLGVGEEIRMGVIESQGDFEVLIPGKPLIDAINMFSRDETSAEIKNEQMILRNGSDRVIIGVLSTEDFPKFDLGVEGEGDVLPVNVLREINEKIAFAVSGDMSRPQLTGVCIKFNGDVLNLVGTDGFRLSLLDEVNFSETKEGMILVPIRAINDVFALAEAENEEIVKVFIQEEKVRIVFIGKNFVYFANLIEATFPPYERIIPLEFTTEVKIGREDLLLLLNKAQVFAKETSNIVKMEFSEQELKMSAKGLSGQYEGSLELSEPVDGIFQIAFNIRYLIDFLAVLKGDELWWGMNENTKPVLLAAKKGDSYRYIAMPFKAQD